MNKIFKVIWNHTTQSWVAVSELTKAHGKTKSLTTAAATVFVALGGVADVQANMRDTSAGNKIILSAPTGTDSSSTGDNSIAMGVNVTTASANSVAIGHNVNVSQYGGSVALGYNIDNQAGTDKGKVTRPHVMIGNGVKGRGNGSITIATQGDWLGEGSNAQQTWNHGNDSIAIGANVHVGEHDQPTGGMPLGAVAIGSDARIGSGTQYTVALGDNAAVYGNESSAVGRAAVAYHTGGVAMGHQAQAGRGNRTNGPKSFMYKDGADNREGEFATSVGAYSKATHNDSSAFGRNSEATANQATALGSYAISNQLKATSVGYGANSRANFSSSLGAHAGSYANHSIAIGGGNSGVDGNSAIAMAEKSIAIGTGARSGANSSIAIGDGAQIFVRTEFNKGWDSPFTGMGRDESGFVRHGREVAFTNAMAIGSNTRALERSAMAFGHNASSSGVQAFAGGYNASTTAEDALALGSFSKATAQSAVAVGNTSTASATNAVAMGTNSLSNAASTVAISTNSFAGGENAIAIGKDSYAAGKKLEDLNKAVTDTLNQALTEASHDKIKKALEKAKTDSADTDYQKMIDKILADLDKGTGSSSAQGPLWNGGKALEFVKAAVSTATVPLNSAIAIGDSSKSIAEKSIALGYGNIASGELSIAVGTSNRVSGNYSGAFGDPSIVEGTASYTFGNDNVVSNKTTGAFVLGNRNRMGAKPTYDADGNDINTVEVDVTKPLTGIAALGETGEAIRDVSGSVVIGNDNTVTSKDTFILGSSINTYNSITTGGGTVANSVYLGKDSTAAAGAAKGTQNLNSDGTPGTSTTAGNTGKVNEATVAGVDYQGFQGNTADGVVTVGSAGHERRIQNVAAGEISSTSTDAINGSQLYLTHKAIDDVVKNIPFKYTVKDQNGDNSPVINIDGKFYKPADLANLQYDPKTKAFYNKTDGSPATAPTEVPANTVNVSSAVDSTNTPDTLNNIKGSLPQTVNRGDKTQDANTVLPTTGVGATDATPKQDAPGNIAAIYNNAATVGDVLNAGWNLQGDSNPVDFVKPYDTVNFIDTETANITVASTDGKTSTIKVDVITTTLTNDDEEGTVDTPDAKDGSKLVNASTVVEAINNSGWKITIDRDDNEFADQAGADEKLIKMGETATFMSGKNLKVKQDNANITFATLDDVEFNSVQLGKGKTGPKLTAEGDNVKVSKADGSPTKITNVAPANITDDSSEAVNGSQLKDAADKLGLTVNNTTPTGFDSPEFAPLTAVNGSDGDKPANFKDAIDKTIAKVNEGIKYGADNKKTHDTAEKQQLGSSLVVLSGDVTENADEYKGSNLITKYENTAGNGTITIGLKEKPEFKEVKVANGTSAVNLASEAAKPATNNDTANAPTNALNLTTDGKPVQITGVGSSLNKKEVPTNTGSTKTNPNGTGTPTVTPGTAGTTNLIDLKGDNTNPVNPNAVATVGDLQNFGWVVEAKDNEYKQAVRNAEIVKFKGEGGIVVTGATNATTGAYELTVGTENAGSLAPIMKKADGATAPTNTGRVEAPVSGLINSSSVANAINNSGWTVGKKESTSGLDFNNKDNLVNPADEVRFADGKNTIAKLNTTTAADQPDVTTVKFDIDLPIDFKYVDADGNEYVKANDGKFYPKANVDENGNPTGNPTALTDDKVTSLTKQAQLTNGINKDGTANGPYTSTAFEADPNKAGSFKPKAYDDANPTAKDDLTAQKGTGGVALNNVAWATNPDQAVNLDQLTQTVKKSGFFVKDNGASTLADDKKDKYGRDTVEDKSVKTERVTADDVLDFVSGTNTKVTAKTERDTTTGVDTTKVTVNVVGLPVQYTDGTGNPVAKVGDTFYLVKEDGTPDLDAPINDPATLVANVIDPAAKPNEKGNVTTLGNIKDNIGVDDKGAELGQTPGTPLAKLGEEARNKMGNNAATVNDVLRAGWNAYVDDTDQKNHKAVVNPTDNVVFKGENGITVTADLENDKGTTVFKFALDEGKVATPEYEIDGTKYQKIGDKYYPVDAATGKPNTKAPLNPDEPADAAVIAKLDAAKPTNNAHNVVTGGNVAQAIRESGWNLGKATNAELENTTFSDAAKNIEKVNPNDNVRFANGKGTIVKAGVFDSTDENGLDVTTTTFKIDVDLPIAYEAKDAAGKELVKANDGKWYAKDAVDPETGRVTDTTVQGLDKPETLGAKLTTNGNNPDEKAYEVLDPITKAIEDVKKANPGVPEEELKEEIKAAKEAAIAKEPSTKDKIEGGKGGVALNNVAWAKEPDQAVNKDQLDQTVNKSGFYVKQNGTSTSTEAANKDATEDAKTEKVTPNDVVDFVDGINTKVTATTERKDGRDVTEVKVNVVGLPVQYTAKDENGKEVPVVKVGDNYYPVDENGNPVTKKPDGSDNAVPAANITANVINPAAKPNETGAPTTLGNIKDNIGLDDAGKPVDQGAGNPLAKPTGYNAETNGHNAATVNDVLRAGWNAYVDNTDKTNHKAVVNPTDNVVFKGKDGIKVTSKGEDNGTTVFEFGLEKGEIITTNDEKPVLKVEGQPDVPVTKVGDQYYKDADLVNGVPTKDATPLTPAEVEKVENTTNKGAGFVTGNQVGDAIQASGFTVGKAKDDKLPATFDNKDEKVNPNDEVRFADGKGTTVSLGTVKATDENGVTKTTTTIKVDVDLPIDYKYKDKDGNEVVKGDDGKFYAVNPETGKADTTKPAVDPANVSKDGAKLTDSADKPAYKVNDPIADKVEKAVEEFKKANPDATPEKIAEAAIKAKDAEIAKDPSKKDELNIGTGGVTLGNVAWATEPDQAVNKDQLDQTVNKSGFFVKQNGKSTEAVNKDKTEDLKTEKVTPNDVVDFVDGGNTKATATTTREDGRDVTKVSVNVVGLPVQYTSKDGVPVTKVGDKFFTVDKDGNPTTTEVKAGDLSINLIDPTAAPNTIGKPQVINNVADGEISPDSKQAVNGSQLYNLQKVVGGNTVDGMTTTKVPLKDKDGNTLKNPDGTDKTEEVVTSKGYTLKTYNVKDQTEYVTNNIVEAVGRMNEEGIKFFHVNDENVNKSKVQSHNKVDSSAAGKYAAAIGYSANAAADNAIALGYKADVTGKQSIAIGDAATVSGEQSISIGTGNKVTGNHSGAFGDPSTVSGDGTYVFGNDNTVTANESFVLGNRVAMNVDNSVALGADTRATAGDKVGTKNLKADGTAGKTTTAGDKGKVTTANVNGMVYGGFAGDTAHGVVSVGAAGTERRIQNVAAGEISATSTDAINGSQLYHVAAKLGDINNQMNRNNRQLRAGIAGANAAAGLPQVYIPGKSMVAASAGTYKGQGAIAVGYSRASDNGKLILKLQGNANTRGDFGGSVGIGYQW